MISHVFYNAIQVRRKQPKKPKGSYEELQNIPQKLSDDKLQDLNLRVHLISIAFSLPDYCYFVSFLLVSNLEYTLKAFGMF